MGSAIYDDGRCKGCWDVFRRGEDLSRDHYCAHCENERYIQDSIDRTEAYEYEKETAVPIQLKTAYPPQLDEQLLLNHCIAHKTSYLCALLLEEERQLEVCRSGAGYYIGATDPETGEPLSRDSQEYYPSAEEAEKALASFSWTQRLHA